MAKVCKHEEQNMKERKCHDYFIHYSKGNRCYCRLSEWKRKKGVCPYDKNIFSVPKKVEKEIKNKNQKQINRWINI